MRWCSRCSGVAGDFFGKTRLMNLCVLVVAISALICALATSFSLLVAMRILAGLVAGGVFPVAMALFGDLVPINQRQVAIARLLGIALTANVLGASIAGVIGDLFGWRGVFAVLGTFSLLAAILAYWFLRNVPVAKPQVFNRTTIVANFRSIFADPRAKVCFSSVFLEAIFIQGLFPYVAILLGGIGETRASIAGLLIACFAIGGVSYSLVVPYLANRVPQPRLMVIGGVIASVALALVGMHFPWQVQIAVYARVRPRLLPAALLHPGPRHRPVADRARGGGLAAFVLVLSRPGDRPGDLWLWLCPRRAGADDLHRRDGGAGRRHRLRAAAAATRAQARYAAMTRTINVVCFLVFASALSVRAIDPVIPQIAADLGVTTTTAAMLGAAFAAYGFVQPVLGPVADAVGKGRVMVACLLLLAVSCILSAVVTSFWLLFVLRILAGAACGGSFPVGMAMISDLVPLAQRQVMIGRLLSATISGNLLGAAAAGIVADVIHWRGMFVILGAISIVALLFGYFGLRDLPLSPPQPLDVRSVLERNRSIFAIRAARICYATVALEALFLFGIFPYVAVLLAKAGEPRATIAGLVVAAFAIGGMVYSLSVRHLLRWFGQKQIMIAGGTLAAIGLFAVGPVPAWPVQAVAFAAMGCGFYMLHASIQVYVTEFAPATRSSAVAFHTFSFFIGGGISPILYGIGIDRLGTVITLSIAGIGMAILGVVSAQLLVKPRPA